MDDGLRLSELGSLEEKIHWSRQTPFEKRSGASTTNMENSSCNLLRRGTKGCNQRSQRWSRALKIAKCSSKQSAQDSPVGVARLSRRRPGVGLTVSKRDWARSFERESRIGLGSTGDRSEVGLGDCDHEEGMISPGGVQLRLMIAYISNSAGCGRGPRIAASP